MPRSSVPASSEPMTRGTILHSMAAAVRDVWGADGLRDVTARLPDEARAATTGPDFATLSFYPTRYILDWNTAIMDGPAHDDEREFRRGVARSIDFGFGRVRRAFLSFATPILLAQRAAELWRHDHTHGRLALDPDESVPGRRRISLTGHPFVTSALGRIAVSEVLRHVLSLSRARNVRETHGMTGDALVIVLTWDA
jgi:hypothetical protein